MNPNHVPENHYWRSFGGYSRSGNLGVFSVLAISGLTTSLSWIFYYRAMKEGPVSYVASIDKAIIVVTLLLSVLILKEPVSARLAAGASCILVGMVILIWK